MSPLSNQQLMINPRPNTSLPHFGTMFWQMILSQILGNTKQGAILSEQAILADLANVCTLPFWSSLICNLCSVQPYICQFLRFFSLQSSMFVTDFHCKTCHSLGTDTHLFNLVDRWGAERLNRSYERVQEHHVRMLKEKELVVGLRLQPYSICIGSAA